MGSTAGEKLSKGIGKVKKVAPGVTAPLGIIAQTGAFGEGAKEDFGFDLTKPFGKDPTGSKAAEKQRQKTLDDLKEHEVKSKTDTSSVTDTTGTSSQVSRTTFDPKSALEESLLNGSLENLNKQTQLVEGLEAGIAGREGVQSGARGTLEDVLSGRAYETTDLERGRIDAVRRADLDIGTRQMGGFLDERLAQLQAEAAQRGVRGQAYSQLQGDVVGEAASSLENRILEANRQAAQSEIDMTGRRVSTQAGVAGSFADFKDIATQKAIENREGLRNPDELAAERDERLQGKTVSTDGTSTSRATTKGGSTTSQVGGGYSGAATQFAGMPSSQQSDIATGISAVGTGVKAYAGMK